MGQFGVMIGQLVGFLIMLMVGYGCVRLRFYGQTALDGMCSLLLNVLIPVLVFSNAVDGADRAQLAANWGVMLLTAVMYALLILVFCLFALTKWWGVLKRYELYVGLVAKMIAFPLAFYALLTTLASALPQLPITHDMILMITVIAGLPTMTTIAMFTGRKNNMPEYAVGFVLVSTLFSLASLTIVSTVVL